MSFVSLQNGLNPGLSGFSLMGMPGVTGLQVMPSPELQQLPLQADFAALLQSLTAPLQPSAMAISQPASHGFAQLKAVLKQQIAEGKLQIVTPPVEGQMAESDSRPSIEVADGATNPDLLPVAWLILPSLKGPVEASIENGQEPLQAPVALLVAPQSKTQDLEEAFHSGAALPIRLVFLAEPPQVAKNSSGKVSETSEALPKGYPSPGSAWVEVPSEALVLSLKPSLKPSVNPPQVIQASLVGDLRPAENEIPQLLPTLLPLPSAASMSQPPLIQIHLPEGWRETLLPLVSKTEFPESTNMLHQVVSDGSSLLPESFVKNEAQALAGDSPKVRVLIGEIVEHLRELNGEMTALKVHNNLPGNSRPGAIPQDQVIQSHPEILQLSLGITKATPLPLSAPLMEQGYQADDLFHGSLLPKPPRPIGPAPVQRLASGVTPPPVDLATAAPTPTLEAPEGPLKTAPVQRSVSGIAPPPVDLATVAPTPALEALEGTMKTAPAAVPQDASKLVKTEVLTAKQSNIQPISNPVQAAQNPTPALAHPERKISTDGDGKSEAPPSEVSKTQALPDDGGNLPELAPNEADVPEVSEPVNPRRTILNPGSDRGGAHLESASLASPPAAQAVTHAREVTPTPARPMAPAVHQVEKSAILDQLAKGIQVHQTPSNSEIRIRLVPDTLGEIHIKISLKADVLVAEIRATSGAAHEVLSKHTLEIQNVLQNAGLQTEQVLVKMAAPPMQGGWTGDATQRDSSSPGQPSRNNSSPRDQGSGDQQQPSRNPSRRNPWDGWDEYA